MESASDHAGNLGLVYTPEHNNFYRIVVHDPDAPPVPEAPQVPNLPTNTEETVTTTETKAVPQTNSLPEMPVPPVPVIAEPGLPYENKKPLYPEWLSWAVLVVAGAFVGIGIGM